MLGNFSWTEMFFIVAAALVIFGPRKIPEIARVLGSTLAQLRRASEEFKRTWEAEVGQDVVKSVTKAQQVLTGNIDALEDSSEEEVSLPPENAEELTAQPSTATVEVAKDASHIEVTPEANVANSLPSTPSTEPSNKVNVVTEEKHAPIA